MIDIEKIEDQILKRIYHAVLGYRPEFRCATCGDRFKPGDVVCPMINNMDCEKCFDECPAPAIVLSDGQLKWVNSQTIVYDIRVPI